MGETALHTDQLTKRFGRITAVDSLDLTVRAGEVFGFLGPNGAGKSTTIRMILGLVRPTAGRAWVFGEDAGDVRSAHKRLAHVPADVALWPRLTGAETLELLGRIGPGVDVPYRDELVRRFDLDLSRPAGTYSTGNRQKVALVAAFATRAPLLVLDEPTSGLDPLMEREFRAAVRGALPAPDSGPNVSRLRASTTVNSTVPMASSGTVNPTVIRVSTDHWPGRRQHRASSNTTGKPSPPMITADATARQTTGSAT